MTNYAAPGAHVGLQVDGSVTIIGGLVIDFGDTPEPPGGDDVGEATAIQEGAVNIADGDDVIGFQAGAVYPDLDES